MNKKIAVMAVALMTLVSAYSTQAQQPQRIPRIGFLIAASQSTDPSRIEAFRQGLQNLGYLEGQNVLIEYRYADGKLDRLPELAAELIRLKVDVIVTSGTPPTSAAQRATKTIP